MIPGDNIENIAATERRVQLRAHSITERQFLCYVPQVTVDMQPDLFTFDSNVIHR